MNSEQHNDLDWLAFQYLADELAVADREAFEVRLADDQSAREALARSVDFAQTLVVAESAEKPMLANRDVIDRLSRWKRLAWFSATLASCLALVFIYQAAMMFGPNWIDSNPSTASTNKAPSTKTPPTDVKSEQLALLWVDEMSQGVESEQNDPVVESEEFLAPVESVVGIDDVETPDWMLAAVVGLSGDMDSDETMDIEKMKESRDN